MSAATLKGILVRHDIDPELWGAWKALVFYGARPSKELSPALTRRFYRAPKYRQCFNAILTALSEAYWEKIGIKWPPKEPAARRAA
jgi:hypothetical protein